MSAEHGPRRAPPPPQKVLSSPGDIGYGTAVVAIFGPFFAMIFLTLAVWIYMYARRIPFIRSRRLRPEQLTPTELARLSPPEVANPSDNLKNLFEVPTIFYALALYLFVTGQVDRAYLIAAWVFVAFRVAHSAVHCTINIVILRFWLYAASTAALGFIAVRASLRAIAGIDAP